MKKVTNFLKRWGVLIGAVVLIILGFILGGAFTRKLRKPTEKIKKELDVMKAGTEAAAHAIEENSYVAINEIVRQEKETIDALNEARHAKYEKLRSDGDAESVMRHLRRFAKPDRRKQYKRSTR